MSRVRSNCRVMTDSPKELVDTIDEMPAIWPSWRSSGAVTEEAITSGAAPGSWVVTRTVGKSTVGSEEIGRVL